jgi:hypothetical protein
VEHFGELGDVAGVPMDGTRPVNMPLNHGVEEPIESGPICGVNVLKTCDSEEFSFCFPIDAAV